MKRIKRTFILTLMGCAMGANFAWATGLGNLDGRLTQAQDHWRQSGAAFFGEALPRDPSTTLDPLMRAQLILDRLIYVSPLRGYDIRVNATQGTQAHAGTNGQYVMIHRNWLSPQAFNDDIVASLLAHELAHIVAHHKAPNQRNVVGKAVNAVRPALAFNRYAALAGTGMSELVNMKDASFSRKQEEEADALAVMMLLDAGYKPEALGEFLQMAGGREGLGFPSSISIPSNVTNPLSVSQAVGLNVLRATPMYRSHPNTTARLDIIGTMSAAKRGFLPFSYLQKKDKGLAAILEVYESRRPK